MNTVVRHLALIAVALAVQLLAACLNGFAGNDTHDGGHFVAKVKPVLEYYCIECHNGKSGMNYGGLNLETGKAAMTTGRHAPVIRPGAPDDSLLYTVLSLGHEEVLGMPPAPDKVSKEQQAAIRKWIRAGAPWPEGSEGRLKLPR